MARNQTGTIEGDETPGSVFMRHSPHDFLALTDDIVKQFSTKHDWHLRRAMLIEAAEGSFDHQELSVQTAQETSKPAV